jgi:hypothetical protein
MILTVTSTDWKVFKEYGNAIQHNGVQNDGCKFIINKMETQFSLTIMQP